MSAPACAGESYRGGIFAGAEKKLSAVKLIAQIEARHGIHGLNAQRLSDFWRWLKQREEMAAANSSVENIREIFASDKASPKELHRWLVDLLKVTGLEKRNLTVLRFVTTEIRKVMQLSHEKEKWQEAQREKIDAGLDAVYEEIKADPVAA